MMNGSAPTVTTGHLEEADARMKNVLRNTKENMEPSTLITILASTFAIMFSMLGMFLWVRSEANNDRRHFQALQREDRKDLLQTTRNLELILEGIQQEMRDFHGRLCALDEKGKK